MVKNWTLSKIAFISFRGRMLKILSYPEYKRFLIIQKNLKMGTSSKAQFTVTVRTVGVYIAKANLLMGICLFYCTRGLKHH